MKRIIRKLKSTEGFTLAETLLAVVILLLASAVVAAGMPAALRAYQNAIDAANAQVLLSATVNTLRSELTTARDVQVPNDKTITYYSAQTGSRSKIYLDVPEGSNASASIQLQAYDDLGEDASLETKPKPSPRPLVSDSMTRTTKDKNDNMTVSFKSASQSEDGAVTIKGLTVKRGDAELAKMDTDLTIRPMNQATAPTATPDPAGP